MATPSAPTQILRAVTDGYVADLVQGDLRSALTHMTRLADAYGLPAVRDLATELVSVLHVNCPGRFRNDLSGVNISALAPARTGDALVILNVASKANRMMGRGEVTALDLERTEDQMRVTETVRRSVQAALNAVPQGREPAAAHLADLTTPQQLSAAVALLTNGLLAVLL